MKIRTWILLMLLFPVTGFSQTSEITSGVYKWNETATTKKKSIASTTLFEGKAHDFEWMQMNSNIVTSSKKISQKVGSNEELLLIVKSGVLTFQFKDSIYSLGSGSIALLMPDEKYSIKKVGKEQCSFYTMKYRSKAAANKQRGITGGGSFVLDWNKIAVKTNVRGFRRDYFDRATTMCKRFEMHVTTLKEGFNSHDPHQHPHEEIILNLDNKTEMLIGDNHYKGNVGDLYFLGSNIFHGVKNDGKGLCSYFAFRFE